MDIWDGHNRQRRIICLVVGAHFLIGGYLFHCLGASGHRKACE